MLASQALGYSNGSPKQNAVRSSNRCIFVCHVPSVCKLGTYPKCALLDGSLKGNIGGTITFVALSTAAIIEGCEPTSNEGRGLYVAWAPLDRKSVV